MAPRFLLRRPYPTNKDGTPAPAVESTSSTRPRRTTKRRAVRFAAASTNLSHVFASMAIGVRLPPISEDVASSRSSNFAAASGEIQRSVTSMRVEGRQTEDFAVDSRSFEKGEGESPRLVSEVSQASTMKEAPPGSIHSGVESIQSAKFAAASPESQSVFASMAIMRKDTAHSFVKTVESPRPEETMGQVDPEISTPFEVAEASLQSTPRDTEPLESTRSEAQSARHQPVFAGPVANQVESGETEEPMTQPEAEITAQAETKDARLSPSLPNIEPIVNTKFVAASAEYQFIFASMGIKRKAIPVAPEKIQELVADPDAGEAVQPEAEKLSLLSVPDPNEAEQVEEAMADLEAKAPTQSEIEGESLPPMPTNAVESERMDQPKAQLDNDIPAQAEANEEPPSTTLRTVGLSERPKFAAASPECWDIFTSMAVGRKNNTVETERIEEPTEPKEPNLTSASDEIESERISEVVHLASKGPPRSAETDSLPLISAEVEPLDKPRFVAASPECWDIFASMAIEAKPKAHAVTTAPGKMDESPGVLESEDLARMMQEDTQTGASELATVDSVSHHSPATMIVEVKPAPKTRSIISKDPVTEPSTPDTSTMSHSQATSTSTSTSAPRTARFAITSPEFQALFASMAIPPRSSCEKIAHPPREYASEPHTPQRVTSPTRNQDHAFPSPPSTPEKKVSLSVGSSPHRRPPTTDLVARRLIGAALGIRMATKKDEKTAAIKKALGMKDRGEGMAVWEEYVAGIER